MNRFGGRILEGEVIFYWIIGLFVIYERDRACPVSTMANALAPVF